MDPATASSILDKHGPMGCALIFVCLALVLFVWKVLPLVVESQSKRLDGIIAGLSELVKVITGRLDQQEASQQRRHEEVKQALGRIETKIDELPQRPTPGNDHGNTTGTTEPV